MAGRIGNNFNYNPFAGGAQPGAAAPQVANPQAIARQEAIMDYLQRAEASYFGQDPAARIQSAGNLIDGFTRSLNPSMSPNQVKGSVDNFLKGNLPHLFSMYQASHDQVFDAWMMKSMWDSVMKNSGFASAGFTDSLTGLSTKMAIQQAVAKTASQMMAPLAGGALGGGRIFG